ncbi:glycosyl hydrolase family 28 protein [Winogradskyella sp.]|uniref:glycoside hydrolase family 28 protein n=1 Tax=Winogradskyella sp. TaxID=1883156 RepID=UPI00261B5C58|nr:glycosyl hydrolase family 28 protein [Winogradskyella sp.]
MKYLKLTFYKLLFLILGLYLSTCQKENMIFNVSDFGAIPDGKTLSTKAIQDAINFTISKKGTLVFPKGTYYSGALTLGPNITIVLEEGCVLMASSNLEDYKHNEFILAPYADNLTIKGKGTINGNGRSFFDDKWQFTERPQPWIDIKDAKNVRIEDITLINSPSHTLNLSYCNGVKVKGLTIKNHPQSPNTDGIDIRNSSNVRISDCDIRTGDDAICVKNDRKPEKWINSKGEARSKITENIHVSKCYIESDDSALKLGTGSGYLTRNISFDHIQIKKTRYAIALFMMDGGRYEEITFSNINATTGSRHKQEYPIFIDVHTRTENGNVGDISKIYFRDSEFNTSGITYISGHPLQGIDSISFKNVSFNYKQRLDNSDWVKPKGNKTIQRWETAGDYVQTKADMLIAHADAVTFENVVLKQDSMVKSNFELIKAKVDTTQIKIENTKQKAFN